MGESLKQPSTSPCIVSYALWVGTGLIGLSPDITDTLRTVHAEPKRCVMSERKIYSPEFKQEAIALVDASAQSASAVAHD